MKRIILPCSTPLPRREGIKGRVSEVHIRPFIFSCTAILLGLSTLVAAAQSPAPPHWSKDALNLFSTLPVQDGGRIKPLDTYAGFLLLRLNGNRDWRDLDGKSQHHVVWFVNTLFFPETSRQYRVFRVEDSAILDDIGVDHTGRKRSDRYSYNELEPGINALFTKAGQYAQIEDKNRTAYQRLMVHLAMNIHEYQRVLHFFDFAHHPFATDTCESLRVVFKGAPTATYSQVMSQLALLRNLAQGLDSGAAGISQETRTSEHDAVVQLLTHFLNVADQDSPLALLPPTGGFAQDIQWFTPTGPPKVKNSNVPVALWEKVMNIEQAQEQEIALLASLEKLHQLRSDELAFYAQLEDFHNLAISAANDRSEYAKVPLEVSLYRGGYFWKALMFYVIAFVLTTILWLRPGATGLGWNLYSWGTLLWLLVPTGFLVYGIVLRCIIRGRPPVSTLYETMLFITAVAVATGIIIEFMNRRKIAMSVAAFLGALGMFLANRYEVKEAVDTMPSLQAVLNTNFWLATHVTVITMGYAAGLLAAAIAHIYILGKFLRIKQNDPKFYTDVTRMVYGVTCFGLCFATVGTVLGGIWANDSWGRFWGWDPKENGALMIVLGGLAIIHGRMGGYIKHHGLSMSAIALGGVVAFSWFGVNLLGVGLHSYGFTSGIMRALITFYVIEGVVLLLGGYAWLREKQLLAIQVPHVPPKRGDVSPLEQAPGK